MNEQLEKVAKAIEGCHHSDYSCESCTYHSKCNSLEAAQLALDAMKPEWTDEVPTVAGDYFWREMEGHIHHVIRLRVWSGLCIYHDHAERRDRPAHELKGQWSGPLLTPEGD